MAFATVLFAKTVANTKRLPQAGGIQIPSLCCCGYPQISAGDLCVDLERQGLVMKNQRRCRRPRSVMFLCLLSCFAFLHSTHAEEKPGIVRVPFDFNGRQIGIDVEWDFKTVHFLFDTGASRHLLEWKLLKTFPQRRKVEIAISQAGLPLGKLPASALEDTPFAEFANGNDVFFHSTAEIERGLGAECSGLIAIPLNSGKSWALNFSKEVIEAPASPERHSGDPFEMTTKRDKFGRIYFTNIGLHHWKSGFLVDTGSSSAVTVVPSVFGELVESGELYDVHAVMISRLAESKETRSGILKRLSFCGFQFENVPIVESTSNKIGIQLLSRFDWVFKDNLALGFPRESVSESFQVDRSGLTLGREGVFVRVHSVEVGSAADLAGLRRSDIVVSIDSENVVASEIPSIRKHMATYDDTIEFVVVRAGEGILRRSLKNPKADLLSADNKSSLQNDTRSDGPKNPE